MKKIRIMLVCIMLILSVVCGGLSISGMADSGTMRNITSSQLMNEITIGCNLGNTLDSVWIGTGKPPSAYETGWGNPVTTKAMIEAYKNMGFNAMRIPVTWFEQMGSAPNYTVGNAWMNRVQEVVDYVLDSGMYCILNTHHEQKWLNTGRNLADTKLQFTALWTQIANRFKNYGDRLIFEGFNEILKKESDWSQPSAKDYQNANALAQTFVDTVRATGGNNSSRHLVVSVYGALHTKEAIDAFVVPTDTVKNRLIVSVHNYDPQPFCWNDVSWAPYQDDWGTDKEKAAIDEMLDTVAVRFAKDNIPVLLGEFGSENKKGNTTARARHAVYVVSGATKRGITCFWWDNGGTYSGISSYKGFGLLDRLNVQPIFTELTSAMVAAAKGPAVPTTTATTTTTSGNNDNTPTRASFSKRPHPVTSNIAVTNNKGQVIATVPVVIETVTNNKGEVIATVPVTILPETNTDKNPANATIGTTGSTAAKSDSKGNSLLIILLVCLGVVLAGGITATVIYFKKK